MTWILIVLALVLVDRVLVVMESRGWIYWRHTKATGTGADSALLELQKIMRPSIEHVQKVKQEVKTPDEDNGDPPSEKD